MKPTKTPRSVLLIVEHDGAMVRWLSAKFQQETAINIISATTLGQAADLIEDRHASIDAILTDFVFDRRLQDRPRQLVDGLDLLVFAKRFRPKAKTFVLSVTPFNADAQARLKKKRVKLSAWFEKFGRWEDDDGSGDVFWRHIERELTGTPSRCSSVRPNTELQDHDATDAAKVEQEAPDRRGRTRIAIDSDGTSRLGVLTAGRAFEASGFAFREQTTSDFGIDAHAELRVGGTGSGQLIAVQVKAGDSYFREATADGWWLRTDEKHVDYWLGHSLPVVVALVDVDADRVFWESVTANTVVRTKEGAKILIPKNKRLGAKSRSLLENLRSPTPILGDLVAKGADCRVFLGRGISGRLGWHSFANVLIREIRSIGCLAEWDIFVQMHSHSETDELTEENDCAEESEGIVSIEIDKARRMATYSVSGPEVESMDLNWNVDRRAAATADAIVKQIMART